jgi:hypothetical protein
MEVCVVRIKPDGSQDLDRREPPPIKTLDQIYEEIIAAFLHAHPTLTREQAEKEFEGFF